MLNEKKLLQYTKKKNTPEKIFQLKLMYLELDEAYRMNIQHDQ